MQVTKETKIEAKDYSIIGKLHAKENPEAAINLLEGYKQSQSTALDTDLNHLNQYFLLYCEINGLKALDYLGALHKTAKVEKRRLFIGAMLKTYKPQMIAYDINAENGIASLLCRILNVEAGNMSNEIHKIITLITNNLYGYADDVLEIATDLIKRRKEREQGPTLFDELEEVA